MTAIDTTERRAFAKRLQQLIYRPAITCYPYGKQALRAA